MLLKLGLIVLFASVLFTQGTAQLPPEPPPHSSSTSSSSSTSTSTSSTTSSTTSSSSTTTPTTSTTTTTTTTTSAPPSTNTTTASPITTSPPNGTTTTETPTTVPPATLGKWRVLDAKNATCILADMAIQVDVAWDINKTDHFIFDVPSNASSSSSKCNDTHQVLVLSWEEKNLSLEFTVNGSNFALSEIVLNVPWNGSLVSFKNNATEFSTPLHKSYHCAKSQDIKLKEDGTNTTGVTTLKVNNVHWEAFHNETGTNFSTAEDCATSSSPDIVPIAVGCALVGLVAIVLIAYLVGRRRSQARGYLSM